MDFLLRRGRDYLALEVKATPRFATPMLAGLRGIGALSRVVRRLLVYRGGRALRTEEGIDFWPVETVPDAVTRDKLWP